MLFQEPRVLQNVVERVLHRHDLEVLVAAQHLQVVERVLNLDDGRDDAGGTAGLVVRISGPPGPQRPRTTPSSLRGLGPG